MKHLRSLYTAFYSWAVRLHVRRYGAPDIEFIEWEPTPEQLEEQARRYEAARARVHGDCTSVCEVFGGTADCTCVGS